MPSQSDDRTERAAAAARPPRSTVLRNAAFSRYLGGFGLSLLGDQVWFVALAWAASRSQDPARASLVIAVGSVPRAALLLLGGTLADRFGALPVALRSQGARIMVMAATAAAVVVAGPDNLGMLLVIAFAFGVLDAAHMPAAAALPPLLLGKEELPAGQGLVQTLERAALVGGAPLGGLIIAVGGLGAAAALNVVLFAIALAIFWRLPTGSAVHADVEAERQSVWRSLVGGMRYARRDGTIGGVLVVITILNFGLAGALNVGLALTAKARHLDADRFGWIVAAFAAGAVLGSLLVTVQRRPKRPAVAGLIWVIAGSGALAAIPVVNGLGLIMTVTAGVGVATGPASALLVGLVQARTDPRYLGRVMSLVNFSALGLTPVSYTLFGVLAGATSLQIAFLSNAALVLVTVLAALTSRKIREARLDPSAR